MTDKVQHYSLGFAFNPDMSSVVLIEKAKGAIGEGMLNGVGGKVEPGEDFVEAMEREFFEEAGVFIPTTSWKKFALSQGPHHTMEVYWTVMDFEQVKDVRTCTAEKVIWVPVATVHKFPLCQSAKWLLQMALDTEVQSGRMDADIWYKP